MRRLQGTLVPIGIVAFWILLVAGLGPAAARGKVVICAAEDEKTTNELMKAFTEETKIATVTARSDRNP